MLKSVLYSEVDKKGRKLSILADLAGVVKELSAYLEPIEDEDEDHHISRCTNAGDYEGHPTEEEREKDLEPVRALLKRIEEEPETLAKEWLDIMPRKKDGTLHKNRVHRVLALRTFCYYSEDSYAWKGPLLSVKNVDDYEAELYFYSWDTVEKY